MGKAARTRRTADTSTAARQRATALKPPPRAVIVELDDQGRIKVTTSGFSELESPALLRLAALTVERKLGIRE